MALRSSSLTGVCTHSRNSRGKSSMICIWLGVRFCRAWPSAKLSGLLTARYSSSVRFLSRTAGAGPSIRLLCTITTSHCWPAGQFMHSRLESSAWLPVNYYRQESNTAAGCGEGGNLAGLETLLNICRHLRKLTACDRERALEREGY